MQGIADAADHVVAYADAITSNRKECKKIAALTEELVKGLLAENEGVEGDDLSECARSNSPDLESRKLETIGRAIEEMRKGPLLDSKSAFVPSAFWISSWTTTYLRPCGATLPSCCELGDSSPAPGAESPSGPSLRPPPEDTIGSTRGLREVDAASVAVRSVEPLASRLKLPRESNPSTMP